MDDLFDLNDYEDKQITQGINEEEGICKAIEGNHEEENKNESNDQKVAENDTTDVTKNETEKEIEIQENTSINLNKEKKNDNDNIITSSEGKENNEEKEDLDDNDEESNESDEEDIDSDESSSQIRLKPKLIKKYGLDDTISTSEFDNIPSLALTFPFELDDFQKRSIIRLERHESVLVCAHTSSGKTVVAEYGIAMGKRSKRRVLYTSPIKALSNQKYRDFKQKFGDVGILTGDVSINPDAQCLIMTTEILQSSLYKNSELLNNVEWVVFDEVHYINDKERGHVWEEILILLPKQIGIIMLSATVPNYLEFAQWVGRIKNCTIYVQNTLTRVVPLEHKLFIDRNNVFRVKDKDNNVLEGNVMKAIKQVWITKKKEEQLNQVNKFFHEKQKREQAYKYNITWYDQFNPRKKKKKGGKGNKNDGGKPNFIRITNMHFKIEEIVDYLAYTQLTPAVIFVFSIKRINEYAKMLSTKQLASKQEQFHIKQFFNQCIGTLPPNDRNIPQILEMREILLSGIGVHHSGLLPILKETIEILYSRGLIKILFATTSFSIGLNMPTRTVVFTEIYKFNDEKKEILSSSEYLQMCGRAGRRGIDTIGNVFLLLTDKSASESDSKEIIDMLKGTGTEVKSKFRLCYRTIVAFFSRNIKEINDFFKESFLENMNIKAIPELKKEIAELQEKKKNIEPVNCSITKDDSIIRDYVNLYVKLLDNNKQLFSIEAIKNKIISGSLLKVRDPETQTNIIVCVVKFYTNFNGELWCIKVNKQKKQIEYETDETVNVIKKSKRKKKFHQFETSGTINNIEYEYIVYNLDNVLDIYKTKIDIHLNNKDINEEEFHFLNEQNLRKAVNDLVSLNYLLETDEGNSKLRTKDYKKLINRDFDLTEKLSNKQQYESEILQSKCHNCPLKQNHCISFTSLYNIELEITKKQEDLNPENMAHYNEFNTRMEILTKLDYIDTNKALTLKGKAAREIATTDCVLITELLLSNVLEKLNDAEIIAFISGFASNKSEIEFVDPKISSEFSVAYEAFEKIYLQLVEMEKSVNDFEENKYNRRLTFSVSKAMKSWMMNREFYEIIKETDLEEGKLYNLIMRIYLFIEEIINFYDVLGNKTLCVRYNEIKAKLLRGIMSIQSLYLQDKINVDL